MMVNVYFFEGEWEWSETIGECKLENVVEFCREWFDNHTMLGLRNEVFENWAECFNYRDENGEYHCIM